LKFRSIEKWEDPEGSAGLLLFAQLMEEMLYDYSLDTYKPPAMNTSTLCFEARSLIDDVDRGAIEPGVIEPVFEELVTDVEHDEVARALLDKHLLKACGRLTDKLMPLGDKRTILELLLNHVDINTYKRKTEQLLIEAVAEPERQDRIRMLTRSYATTLLALGYSSRFLYSLCRKHFHESEIILGPGEIRGFFKHLKGKAQKYAVVLRASKAFEDVSESCNAFGLKITSGLVGRHLAVAKSSKFDLGENQTYVIVENIQCRDVFFAREHADQQIEIVRNLMGLFNHRGAAEWDEMGLVLNESQGTGGLVKGHVNQMHLYADLKPGDALSKLDTVLGQSKVAKGDSFQQLFRAADLHSLALKDASLEGQLISLWAALETLAPPMTPANKSRVQTVIDAIIPFLQLEYIPAQIRRLHLDLGMWNGKRYEKALADIEEDDEILRLMRLLLLGDHRDALDALLKDIGHFHLLRQRLLYFRRFLSKSKRVLAALESYAVRVEWQIWRIYRARNLVVHASQSPPNLGVLVNNAHGYLDTVTGGIVKLWASGQRVDSVAQYCKYAEIQCADYLEALGKESGNIDGKSLSLLLP
jgi:hypothetical protein